MYSGQPTDEKQNPSEDAGWAINQYGYRENKAGLTEHRLVYEKHYGKIYSNNHIHHIDENKLNNSPENLISLPPKLHSLVHRYHALYGKALERKEIELLSDFELVREREMALRKRDKKKKRRLEKLGAWNSNKSDRAIRLLCANCKIFYENGFHKGACSKKCYGELKKKKKTAKDKFQTILRKEREKLKAEDKAKVDEFLAAKARGL